MNTTSGGRGGKKRGTLCRQVQVAGMWSEILFVVVNPSTMIGETYVIKELDTDGLVFRVTDTELKRSEDGIVEKGSNIELNLTDLPTMEESGMKKKKIL